MIKAVIFDMDGVIIDSEPLNYQHKTIYLKNLGIILNPLLLKELRGTNSKTFWARIINEYKLSQSLEYLITDSRKDYLNFLQSIPDLQPIQGIKEVIQSLVANNIVLALASSASLKRIDTILTQFNMLNAFQAVVCGDDVVKSKPDPEIYVHTAQRIGIDPSFCVVVEDATNGIIAAKRAGMKVIGFSGTNTPDQNIKQADIIVKSLDQITLSLLNTL